MYNQNMNRSLPNTSFSMGYVTLNVRDIDVMKDFYQHTLLLDKIFENDTTVQFGKNGTLLLELNATPDRQPASLRDAGLYHFAILYSSGNDLANTVKHILIHRPDIFAGSADHLVSEAFYFTDPEGNGIELYVDRNYKTWVWNNGSIAMSTNYLNPNDFILRNSVPDSNESGISIGHIHLKVGDLNRAKKFYVNCIGFQITAEFPGALFLSFDRYHHHIGLNIWESDGAGRRTNSSGLASFEFVITDQVLTEKIINSIKANNVVYEEDRNKISFSDPWNNQIMISKK